MSRMLIGAMDLQRNCFVGLWRDPCAGNSRPDISIQIKKKVILIAMRKNECEESLITAAKGENRTVKRNDLMAKRALAGV